MLIQNHKSLYLNEFAGVKSSEENETENMEMFLSMIPPPPPLSMIEVIQSTLHDCSDPHLLTPHFEKAYGSVTVYDLNNL
jgi:hypothetical protein